MNHRIARLTHFLARSVALVPAIFFAAGCVRSPGRPPEASQEILVLEDVHLIDGTGAAPRPHQTVVISGRRIARIHATGTQAAPAGAVVLKLSGATVIPGLFDSHVHATLPFITTERQDSILGFMFRGGVTSIRDMAGDAVVLRARASAASDPLTPFPRIFFSALFAGPTWMSVDGRVRPIAHGLEPGQAPWLRAVSDTTDIVEAITAARLTGATGIKMYADMTPSQVDRVAAEARRQGLRVWSHAAIIPARPSDAVTSGVQVLSHVMSIVLEAADTMPGREGTSFRFHDYDAHPVTSEAITRLLTLMKQRGSILEPTLFATRLRSQRASLDSTQRRFVPLAAWGYAFTRRAREMGIPVLAGTDLMGNPRLDDLPYIHSELELLVAEGGLSPLEALTAATGLAASVVGASDSLGTIAEGKLADLVVLTADPVRDIRNTRAIQYVIKGGRLIPRVGQ